MMDSQNVLSAGVEVLYEMKESILELEEYKEKFKASELEESRLEKEIFNKEKLMNEEINSTIMKRREEVLHSFDKLVDKIETRNKKVKTKKEKFKSAKMSERMKMETAELVDDNRNIKGEIKEIFRKNHVPSYCNTKLFYALFAPKGLGDLGIALLFVLLVFLLLPCGIYFFCIPERKIWQLVLIYFIDVVISIAAYVWINRKTRENHLDDILQVRTLRRSIKINKKKIKAHKKSIWKDKDESAYGLDKFNEELKEIEEQMEELLKQKKEVLSVFDNTTSLDIKNQIQERYQEGLGKLKADFERTYEDNKTFSLKVEEKSLEITKNYEGYVGKEFLPMEKLNQLIEIMESGNISTISEAMVAFTHRVSNS